MTLHLRYAARSDVGLVRERNEDSGYAGPHLLVVADGMGGHAAGELASATAVAALAELDDQGLPAGDVLTALSDAIDRTGATIRAVIARDPLVAGMGTTMTAVYWNGGRIAVAHIGDTRAYLLRDRELSQITHDHTLVQSLIDQGHLTEAEAAVHPRRSVIMRALDGTNPVEPDLSVREARIGDRYLLCSDGLSGVMSMQEIGLLLGDGDPTGAVSRLVELALERGAPDNVTVVVADVIQSDELEGQEPVVVGAAGEHRVREQLPEIRFPADAEPGGGAAAQLSAPPRVASSEPRGRRRWPWLVAVAVVIAGVVGSVLITNSWIASQWYVAQRGPSGTVAIYNGVPGSFAGFDLSSLSIDTGLIVGTLREDDQDRVRSVIPAADEADAKRIVAELQQRATACQVVPPPPGCPGAEP